MTRHAPRRHRQPAPFRYPHASVPRHTLNALPWLRRIALTAAALIAGRLLGVI